MSFPDTLPGVADDLRAAIPTLRANGLFDTAKEVLKAVAVLDAAVNEMADLRADKARLDHLETNLHDFRRLAPQVSMNPGPVRFSAWTPKHGRRHDYPTLRAALDDVLSQQQP